MSFYYDIVVNFQDDNWMFYEWEESDCLEAIKKIPVLQVSIKVIKDIIGNNIQVSKSFLESIHNKTKIKKGFLEYSALFASKNGAIVLEFNDNGVSIARSYLQVNDECNILETLYTIPMEKLEYKIVNKLECQDKLRSEKIVKDLINLEINTLYQNKKWEKIVFLYNEWFKKSKRNVAEMIKEMQHRLNGEITEDEIKIYNLIKLSYNNV